MIVENCAFLKDPRVRREAKGLISSGHRVSVIAPGEGWRPKRENLEGIAVYSFPFIHAGMSWSGYLLEYGYATIAIAVLSLIVLLREGFDIIHVANPPDTLVLTLALYKVVGKRIIYDQHDLCPELYKAKYDRYSPHLFRILHWLERQSYAFADHVITTNESYKQIAMTRGGVTESKVTVVRNGPNLESLRLRNADVELRARSKNIIVYTGVIGFQDGLDCLCRILRRLRYDLGRADFCCVVVGDGDALSSIKALAHDFCLQDNVWFTGWVDDSDLYFRYLNTADICISPEPSNEYNNVSTFVKIMEYMVVGKPIVAFDLAESRRSASDAAIYVARGDESEFAAQLARLMDDPVLRSKIGSRGQDRIRRELAWEYSVPKLLEAYNRCLSRGGGSLENRDYTGEQGSKVNLQEDVKAEVGKLD